MNVFKLIEDNGLTLHGDFEHFAELIRQEEREACAKVCEAYDDRHPTVSNIGYYLGKQIRERNKHENGS